LELAVDGERMFLLAGCELLFADPYVRVFVYVSVCVHVYFYMYVFVCLNVRVRAGEVR
jgi:hypothetical protein